MKFHKQIFFIFYFFFCFAANGQLRFCADAGFSRRFDFNDTTQYNKGLLGGTNYNFELNYYTDGRGIGLKISSYTTSNGTVNFKSSFIDSISDKILINYYAFQFGQLIKIAQSNFYFNYNGGFGLLYYFDDNHENSLYNKIKGHTVGFHVNTGIDYKFCRYAALGVNCGMLLGVLRELNTNGYTNQLNPKKSLLRFDLNAGLRFYY